MRNLRVIQVKNYERMEVRKLYFFGSEITDNFINQKKDSKIIYFLELEMGIERNNEIHFFKLSDFSKNESHNKLQQILNFLGFRKNANSTHNHWDYTLSFHKI
jgi:hypothetical protein